MTCPDFVDDTMGEKAAEGGLAVRGESKIKTIKTTPCLHPMREGCSGDENELYRSHPPTALSSMEAGSN